MTASTPALPQRSLQGDIFGGLTAGVVALPLALAFGVASGAGPLAGMYGAIAVGLMAAIFGGTPAQISGPTGPMTVVAASILTSFGRPEALFLAVALAGVFQIVLGRLKLGSYIRYIPYPVISGFMTGIGAIIILLQLHPLAGLKSLSKPLDVVGELGTVVASASLPALGLGLATIAVVYLMPRLLPQIPGSLIALIGGTIAAAWLGLDVPKIGPIPSGLPQLQLPPLEPSLFATLFLPAVTLAMLGAIDSLLTSLVADQITKEPHDSNRELFGQGLGNALAGLIGGIPGAGATMRTVVNVKNGGRGRLSGVVHSLVLIAILAFLGPWAAQIPLAVLAGILVTVGIGVLDFKGLGHIRQVPRADTVVMAIVLGLTVFVDLIQAVAAGLLIAGMLLFKRIEEHASHHLLPLSDLLDEGHGEDHCVARLQGPATFADAKALQGVLETVPSQGRGLIVDFAQVPFIDQSGAYALEESLTRLMERDMAIVASGLQAQPAKLLAKLYIVPGLIPADQIAPDITAAHAKLNDLLNARQVGHLRD